MSHKPAVLTLENSVDLRKQLITEIRLLTDDDAMAAWAHKRLSAKNTLTAVDAKVVEAAYEALLKDPHRERGS